MSLLVEKGIVKVEGVISKLFENMTPGKSFCDVHYQLPHEYIKFYWEKYLNSKKRNNSIAGVFSELIM